MRAQIIEVDGTCCLSIEMENTIDRFNLLKEFTEYGNTIQRMYWRSKYDYNYIEYFEPKIYDAFIFCVDFVGRRFTLENVLKNYKPTCLEKYEKEYNSLTDLEIKILANKMISIL